MRYNLDVARLTPDPETTLSEGGTMERSLVIRIERVMDSIPLPRSEGQQGFEKQGKGAFHEARFGNREETLHVTGQGRRTPSCKG